MKYFSPPFTEDHIRSQFRELSKKLHPDKGGAADEFQKMKEEKETVEKLVNAWRTNKKPVIKRATSNATSKSGKEVPKIIINLTPQAVREIFKAFNFFNNGR
jgi:DnaJ-class molecular chaperone